MLRTLLVKNASVFDVETGSSALTDILVRDGIIVRMEQSIEEAADIVKDASGMIVTPGLVDFHTHVFHSSGDYFGIDPYLYHLPAGVTYAIDQGSAGADCYDAYRERVLMSTPIRVKSFLNCARIGMPVSSLAGPGELANPEVLSREAFIETYEKHRDELMGIKIRVTPNICPVNPKPFIEKAMSIAEELGVRLCIHPNQALMDGDELLDMLRPGDVMTHTYHRSEAGILDKDAKVKDAALRARARGVRFDTGHGLNSLAFSVMRKGIEQGFLPDTISTDVHNGNINGPVFSLACTISKFLCLGVSLQEALKRCTTVPTELYGLTDKKNKIEVGDKADFAAFYLDTGHHVYHDAEGGTLEGDYRLMPRFTVFGDRMYVPGIDSRF